jgi:hypothetical protein
MIFMGNFWIKERVFTFGPLRGAYFGTFVLFFLLTEWGRKVYRPYVYANGVHDWGLADVMGNLGGALSIVFFNLACTHATRVQGLRMIGLVTVGLMAYEVIQGVLPRSVFDWKDMVATLLAGLIALGLLLLLHWLLPESAVADKKEVKEPA